MQLLMSKAATESIIPLQRLMILSILLNKSTKAFGPLALPPKVLILSPSGLTLSYTNSIISTKGKVSKCK